MMPPDTTGVVILSEFVTVTVARDVAWVLGVLLAIGAMTCALTARELIEDAWHAVWRGRGR